MNNKHRNGIDPKDSDLNGKPYYSRDRGFACAAAGRGIAEKVREHINVIIRNEELEIASNHGKIREEIHTLQNEKNKLEGEKDSCQKEIRACETEIAQQEVALAELNAKLNAPAETEGISTPNPRIKALREEKKEQEQKLANKKIGKKTLKVKSKVPLTVEILKTMVDLTGVDTPKIGFSWKQFLVALGYTFSLIGLIGYVYVFYASVAAKSFSPDNLTEHEQTDEGTLNQYVDPSAWYDAWEKSDPPNLFVLLFPMIFIGFAVVLHFCVRDLLETISRKWLNIGAAIFLILTLFFDGIIADRISQNIEDLKRDRIEHEKTIQEAIKARFEDNASAESTTTTASAPETLSPFWLSRLWNWLWNLLPIIFLGFVPTLLLTGSIYATLQSWSKVRPWGEYIKKKKHEYDVELASLGSQIAALENDVNSLDTQIDAQIKADRHPIRVKIDRMETEKGNTEKEIKSLETIVRNIQEEVDRCEKAISTLNDSLKLPERHSIDLKKMEKNVYEFVSGWREFIIGQRTELTDPVNNEIEQVYRIADQTLQDYKSTLTKGN